MARPQKSADQRRDGSPIKVRVNQGERNQITAAAERAGMPVSTFMRNAALGQTIRAKPSRSVGELVRQLSAIGNNINQLTRQANAGRFPVERDLQHVLAHLMEAIRRV